MKKIILVTGLIIFAGIKTSFSFVFEEGIGGFNPSARPIIEDVTPTERITPRIADVTPSKNSSDLGDFTDAVIGKNWDTAFNPDLVGNTLSNLEAIIPQTEISPEVRKAIKIITDNSNLINTQLLVKKLKDDIVQSTADTIAGILAKAQELQAQFLQSENPIQTRLDTLVSQLETADEKEATGILQLINKELEDGSTDVPNILQALVGKISEIREKNQHVAIVLPLETISRLMDASISPKRFIECLDGVIYALNTQQNTPMSTTVEDEKSTVKAGVTVEQAVIHHREEVPKDSLVVGEISRVLNEIWGQSPATLKGKEVVLEAVALIDEVDLGKAKLILSRFKQALENGDPAQIAAAIAVIEQNAAGLSARQIAGLRAVYSATISPDKQLAENESTAVLITASVPVSMPINIVREGRELSVKGIVDETAGNTVSDKKIAESFGCLSSEDIGRMGGIVAQQIEEKRGETLGTIAGGIVELAKSHYDLAVDAARNLGLLSKDIYVKDAAAGEKLARSFVNAITTMDKDNAGALISAFAAGAGRGILDGMAEEIRVPAIQTPNGINQSPHMGTFGSPVGGAKTPTASSYAYNTADGRQAGDYRGPITANPSAAVPVAAVLSLNSPAIVPPSNYVVINGEAVIPQDLMQAFITQTGREEVKVDKGTLVRALESIGGNIDISLAGLNLSDYAATLMFQNSLTNFIQLLYNDLRGVGSLKNVDVNGKDFMEFASPQAIIKEILKQLKRNKKTTDQRAKLKLAFPERVPLKAFMIIFLSMVIFAIVLGRSVAKYYLDTAIEKKSGCF